VADLGPSVIGFEMVVHDHAALKALGQGAPPVRHPIRGQGLGRGGAPPLALAGAAKAGFVEMARRGSNGSAFLSPPATTLSGQSRAAPNRSAIACATRSSGMSCCTLR